MEGILFFNQNNKMGRAITEDRPITVSSIILVVGVVVKTIAFSTKLLILQFGISILNSVPPFFFLAVFFGELSVGTSQSQWA